MTRLQWQLKKFLVIHRGLGAEAAMQMWELLAFRIGDENVQSKLSETIHQYRIASLGFDHQALHTILVQKKYQGAVFTKLGRSQTRFNT